MRAAAIADRIWGLLSLCQSPGCMLLPPLPACCVAFAAWPPIRSCRPTYPPMPHSPAVQRARQQYSRLWTGPCAPMGAPSLSLRTGKCHGHGLQAVTCKSCLAEWVCTLLSTCIAGCECRRRFTACQLAWAAVSPQQLPCCACRAVQAQHCAARRPDGCHGQGSGGRGVCAWLVHQCVLLPHAMH